MRSLSVLPLTLVAVSTALLAQTPVLPTTTAGQTQTSPPATQQPQKSTDPVRAVDPLTQRDEQLKKYDPLAKPDTAAPSLTRPVPGSTAGQDPRLPVDRSKDSSLAGDALEDVTAGTPVSSGYRSGSSAGGDLTREYTGPAVLTRTYAVERPPVPENLRFRPFAGVSAIYDTGLTGVAVRPDGTADNRPSFGTMFLFGFEGRHYWKHDILQAAYSGNASLYSPASEYNGSNHNFSLNWTHLLQRHLKLSFESNIAHYSQNYNLTNPIVSSEVGIANVNLATTPNTQIFDNSTTQTSNGIHLTWQKTARLSFDFSGSYFFVKRAGVGLIGSEGVQGGNDVSYRLTRKTTIGAYYSYTYYRFSKGAGNTNTNNFGAIYSYAFNPRTELRTRVGLNVLQNLGITSVSIDPAIAALLGQSAGLVQYYSVNRLLDVSASLTRQLRGGRSVHTAFTQGTTPGNGLFVASKQQVIDAGFSTKFRRRYQLSFTGGRSALNSVSQAVGHYNSEYAHFDVVRPLDRSLNATFGFDYRRFEITGSPLLRDQYRIALGFTWSNPDFPNKIF